MKEIREASYISLFPWERLDRVLDNPLKLQGSESYDGKNLWLKVTFFPKNPEIPRNLTLALKIFRFRFLKICEGFHFENMPRFLQNL